MKTDSGLAVRAPRCQTSRSVVDRLILIPAARRAWSQVFTSKYHKVRIFKVLRVSQKSKKWVADPANRKCDALGC